MDELTQIANTIIAAPAAHAVAALLAALVIGNIVARLLRAVITRVTKRTTATWDDRLAAQLAGPVSWLIALQLFHASLAWITLPVRSLGVVANVIAMLTVLIVIWGVFRVIDLMVAGLEQRSWARNRASSRSVLALGSRFVKGAALVIGVLVALTHLGVSVASLLAGLGIGGLALALAAQKTVENLFGAVSIGIDQPLREGDFVKVGDVTGTVEEIGLRSTRIRTLDRTIVTLPNGDLSNQRIECYTVRDRFRLATTIGVEYGTTATQMRDIVAKLETILREHDLIYPDDIVVRFVAFSASSLDIEIMAWFLVPDFGAFRTARQEVLLAFMDAIEAAGTGIAFPTRTLHIASVPPELYGRDETPRRQPRSAGSAPAA